MDHGWTPFVEKRLPGVLNRLKRAVGRDIDLQIDWVSFGLGDADDRDRLDYALKMLTSGLEGRDTHNPFVPTRQKIDPATLSAGVERIAMKRVESVADSCIALADGTLRVQFPGYNTFEPGQIEAALLDRGLKEFDQHVTPLPAGASPAMWDLRQHRLPALFQGIARAMERTIPFDIEWNSFGHGFEAPPRMLYLLGETKTALSELARETAERVVGPPHVHERAEKFAKFRSETTRKSIERIRVRGAYQGQCPPVEFSGTTLTLNVYIDPTTTSQGKVRPDYDLRIIDACKAAGIQRCLIDALKLELTPLLERLKNEDVPKAQAHLRVVLDDAVSSCRGLKVPERTSLRKLAAVSPVLAVDWNSFLAAPTPEATLSALKSFETGHYNYNCDFGPFLANFFYALKQALGDADFLHGFIERIKEVRCRFVADPNKKELALDGNTIVLCQGLDADGGFLDSEQAAPLTALVAMAQTGAVAPPSETIDVAELETRFEKLGEQLKAAFGPALAFEFDPALGATPAEASALSQRGILPVLGAVTLLRKKSGYADHFQRLTKLHFARTTTADPYAHIANGVLTVHVDPGADGKGWLDAEALAQAIDNGLALRARSEIAEREKESRAWWQSMLKERFERDVPLEIAWDDFLKHPTQGGNVFYPFYLEEAGIRRLLYALTDYMDEDADFRTLALIRVTGLRIACAATMTDVNLDFSNGLLTYRCFANMEQKGYLNKARLQERLYEVLA